MTHHEQHDEEQQEREPRADPVQEEQKDKGYGQDEGERDEALEEQNLERL